MISHVYETDIQRISLSHIHIHKSVVNKMVKVVNLIETSGKNTNNNKPAFQHEQLT